MNIGISLFTKHISHLAYIHVEVCFAFKRNYQPTMMVSNEVASTIPDGINAFFQMNQVDVIVYDSILMNCKVPFIDKIEAASNFEKICDAAYLWMDVDSCFITPLHISISENLPELAVNPVDKRNIGDRYDDYFDNHQPPQALVTYFEEEYKTLKSSWYY